MLKNYNDPKHKPVTAQQVRDEIAAEEQRRREAAERPVKEAEAQLTATHRKLHSLEKSEILAGRKDPGWKLPSSADGLSMSLDEAKEFNRKSVELFYSQHPEYYPTPKNFQVIRDYLVAQEVGISTADCWAKAFERLTAFGLLEERPLPAPESVPTETLEEVEPAQEPVDGLTAGWDVKTGQERSYTATEIHQMSADEYKRAFKLWRTRDGDRRPLMRRSFYQ